MDIPKIFGAFLAIIGIVGLIYTAVMIINDTEEIKKLIVVGILGGIFFFSGISLQRPPKGK
jgi:uncharacterized membrane protein